MDMACSMHGEKANTYKILVRMPEGQIPLGRASRRWEASLKVDLRRIEWGIMNCIELAHDGDQWRAVLNTVMVSVKCLEVRVQMRNWRFLKKGSAYRVKWFMLFFNRRLNFNCTELLLY